MSQSGVKRPTRTGEELAKAAEDVVYEVGMLHQLPLIWGFLPLLNGVFSNMAIESFLVHFRNVRDFLYPAEKWKEQADNVIASDFNPLLWKYDSSSWSEVVSNERDRINKQLSHVSYARQHYPKPWPIENMARAMLERFCEFLKKLPAEKRNWFRTLQAIFPEQFI